MPFRPSFRFRRRPNRPNEPPHGQEDTTTGPVDDLQAELEAEAPENEALAESEATPGSDLADTEDDNQNLDDPAQPFAEDSVKEDMATAAVHPQTHVGGTAPVSGAAGLGPGAALAPGAWSQLSDAEIMLRVAAGDEAGFTLLVEKYRRQMVHYMYRMVHNQAVAEELAQEVFLRVYRARTSYRAEAKFSTWIYRIATNLGVNHARDTRHERGAQAVYLDQPDPETGISPDVADATPTVEQDMVEEARRAAIRKHVMALPERQRTAVLMHKYQDLDYKQIGAVLKLSESATKSLLFRAYQTLRERLKEFV
jgi:RNA polymerase sigma-70 factor (ECF subfamily)